MEQLEESSEMVLFFCFTSTFILKEEETEISELWKGVQGLTACSTVLHLLIRLMDLMSAHHRQNAQSNRGVTETQAEDFYVTLKFTARCDPEVAFGLEGT
jgi:hypothetical protein